MDQQQIDDAAALLAGARGGDGLLPELPGSCRPETVADAHAIQDAVTAALGETVGGFKANAPPNDEPTRGVIYAPTVHPTPAEIPAEEVPNCGVEGEIAFFFRHDLPPRAEPYTREEVAAAVDVCAAIEVVDSRFRDQSVVTPMERLADCISNGGFVYGPAVSDWQKLDLASLHVYLSVNGLMALAQQGGHPIKDPLGPAVALVNLMRDGGGVRAGQFVTTGSCTGLRYLKPGDSCTVQFDELGSATVTFTE
jgi:2-keto-4-pentenoate hydratase